MGPVLVGDLVAVARVLRHRPRARWPWVCARLMAEARRGAGHLARDGRPHPRYGDGSLLAAALRRRPEAAPALDEARFRDALRCALAALEGGAEGACRRGPGGRPGGGVSRGREAVLLDAPADLADSVHLV